MTKIIIFCAVMLALSWSAFAEDKKKKIPEYLQNKYDQRAEDMKGFDRNRDGILQADELRSSMNTKFDAADTNKDGIISSEEAAASLRKFETKKEKSYGASDAKQQTNRMKNRLKNADKNKDGLISKQEYEGYMKNHQANFDRNGDGVISKDEYRTDGERLPGAYLKKAQND